GAKKAKRFRLDFGNDPKLKKVDIRSLFLVFKDKTVSFNGRHIFDGPLLTSTSMYLNREDRLLEANNFAESFDPYIVLPPLGQYFWSDWKHIAIVLSPFLILTLLYVVKHRKAYNVTVIDVLLLGFIICI